MDAPVSRLSKADYLLMGLEVLVADGAQALTAARMSRELSVSTGSFYWHFNTVAAFRDELKRFWHDEIVIGLITEAEELAENRRSVLPIIGEIIKRRGTYRYDRAMRRWAESDQKAAKIVAAADESRRTFIASAIEAAGEPEDAAANRTNLLGAAWLGSQGMPDPDERFKMLGLVWSDRDSSS